MQVFLSEFVRAPRDRQLAAWIAALTASLATLFIAEIMGQSPCNLCSFQRAFMFPLAIVLGIACLIDDVGVMAADVTAILTQDLAELRAVGVRQTPTCFVTGKSLPSFGVRQLVGLVRSEDEALRRN